MIDIIDGVFADLKKEVLFKSIKQSSLLSSLNVGKGLNSSKYVLSNQGKYGATMDRKIAILSKVNLIQNSKFDKVSGVFFKQYGYFLEMEMTDFQISELEFLKLRYLERVRYSSVDYFNRSTTEISSNKKQKNGIFNIFKSREKVEVVPEENEETLREIPHTKMFSFEPKETKKNINLENEKIPKIFIFPLTSTKTSKTPSNIQKNEGENSLPQIVDIQINNLIGSTGSKIIKHFNFLKSNELLQYFELDNLVYQELKQAIEAEKRSTLFSEKDSIDIFSNNDPNQIIETKLDCYRVFKNHQFELFEKSLINFLVEEESLIKKSEIDNKTGGISSFLSPVLKSNKLERSPSRKKTPSNRNKKIENLERDPRNASQFYEGYMNEEEYGYDSEEDIFCEVGSNFGLIGDVRQDIFTLEVSRLFIILFDANIFRIGVTGYRRGLRMDWGWRMARLMSLKLNMGILFSSTNMIIIMIKNYFKGIHY